MTWPEFSLKHRYVIFALTLAVIFLGIFSKQTLKIELFPDTAPPLVNVITTCPGMSAEDTARDVSKPLEEEFATLEGVKKISSTSQDGLSLVKVEFHYNVDVDGAAVDVQNAISRVKRVLPAGVEDSRVLKFSTSDRPVMTLSIGSDKLSLAAVRDLADNELKNRLQLVEGVAAVDVFGGYQRQINVFLDRQKLEALGIPLDQVTAAIRSGNVVAPGGRITQDRREYLVRVVQDAESARDIGNLILQNREGRVVTLKDVARIEDATAERRSEFRFAGRNTIAVQILKKKEANTVDVVENVTERLENLKRQYPSLDIKVADDDAAFTTQVVENMTRSVTDAMVLATVVILFFLVNLTQSFVVALSMPLTFLGTFAVMRALNMELNLITLSALILSVGIVVDHAIVVVENIIRQHEEMGKDLYRAAVEATQEVMLPLAAGTYATVIVLVPLLFIGGFVGRVFGPLATTLIIAFSISLLVSITVIPLLTVLLRGLRWKKGEEWAARLAAPFGRFMEGVRAFYLAAVRRALRRRALTIAAAALTFLIGAGLLRLMGMEVLPKMDAGSFFISIQTEPGTSLERTSAIAARVEKLLEQEPEVVRYSTQIGYEAGGHYFGESGALGVNQAMITVTLTSRKERRETIWDIEERLRRKIALIPGIETFVVKETGGTAVATTLAPIDVRISGPDKKVLDHLAGRVQEKVEKVPGAVNVYRSWSLNNPELHIRVDEARAAELGLSPAAVAAQVFHGVQGAQASVLRRESGGDTAIVVRYDERYRRSPADLENVLLATPQGLHVPLRDVARVEESWGATVATREDLEQTVHVLGFTHGRAFSHVVADIARGLREVPVPDGYSIDIVGEQADLKESFGDLKFALLLAVIGVYLLLLAQFRSFVHPLTIMVAIPLVLIGVALALLYSGKSVSLPVLLGLILLAGTVVNNSILLVDYTNRGREAGLPRDEAVVQAVGIRFRPIMMTALADVAGMLPLALEWSLGAERFSPLAIAVIGGILTATLLTMVVIPVVYATLDDLAAVLRRAPRPAAQQG